MAQEKHKWVDGELITAEKLNNLGNSEESGNPNLFNNLNNDIENLSVSPFSFSTRANLVRNAVMQYFSYAPKLGQWFVSQADVSTPEGFVLHRLAGNGQLLSQMWFNGLGHGVNFWTKEHNNEVYVFLTVDATLYKIKYSDNTTITTSDLTKVVDLEKNNGAISEYDGTVAYLNGNNESGWNLNITTGEYDGTNQVYSNFSNNYSIELNGLINEIDLLQGVSIAPKDIVSGDSADENSYFIFILTGSDTNMHKITTYEFSKTNNAFSIYGKMNNVSSMAYANLGQGSNNWLEYCEPEGITFVDCEQGTGLFFGLTTGSGTKRQHYIYGSATTPLQAKLNATNLSFGELKIRNYIPAYINKLSDVMTPGTYNIQNGEFSKFSDIPDFLTQYTPTRFWTFVVSEASIYGDFSQELIAQVGNSFTHSYKRDLLFAASDGYGSSYKAHTVGYWKWNDITSNYIISGITNLNIKKMRDFNIVGASYYVSTTDSQTLDLEGAESYLSGKEFKVDVLPWSGEGTGMIQRVTRVNGSIVSHINRVLTQCSPIKNGPNLTTSVENTPWSFDDGTILTA